ncbi:MAG TPA: hypothetical protein VLI39_07000 [Sedimentisphaerales bacterium]|nr:hypothetical protein [Sedimentisphaerales bacterium]
MASVAQIQANRLNAQKSTGPRTAEGKERASQNAVKHGLLAKEAVIVGEDPAEFEMYREGMIEALAPVGPVEAMLAERVVGLSWRLRRAERLQNVAFAALDEGEPTELLEARLQEWKQLKGSERDRAACGVLDESTALAQKVVEDFAGARVLDRMLMYERRIESSLYRTIRELRRERETRVAASEPEGVLHSERQHGGELRKVATEVTEGHRERPRQERENTATCEPLEGSPGSCPSGSVSSVGSVAQTPISVSDSQSGLAADREAVAEAELASFDADSTGFCPGGSDKRSLRSLSMAPSQEQDHRQTSLSMPPGVEASRSDFTLGTREAFVRNEPNSGRAG